MLPRIVCLLLVFLTVVGGNYNPVKKRELWVEKKLLRHLLDDYDKRSRPVVDNITKTISFNNSNFQTETVQQVTVEFGLGLIQILDLNEMDQVLTTSVRSLYRWKDHHLIWNPNDFDNITEVNIPTNSIWLPDIALYNYADERLEERRECDAKVFHDGTVEWHPMAIYKSTCSVHIKKFPFDTQACRWKFGPWTYDGFRVNITFYNNIEDLDNSNYVDSPEWHVLSSLAKFTQISYPCCPEPYPDISFYIWIQRRPAFYNYILILPCFLLSSLTLVLFWLPPETPAKMVLGMNIFVAFFLLLLLLEDSTPSASSTFPIIGTYYCLNMSIITLSTFLCLIVVNFHFRGDSRREVPYWLKKLAIQYGAKYLWVNVGPRNDKKEVKEQEIPKKDIPMQYQGNYYTPSSNQPQPMGQRMLPGGPQTVSMWPTPSGNWPERGVNWANPPTSAPPPIMDDTTDYRNRFNQRSLTVTGHTGMQSYYQRTNQGFVGNNAAQTTGGGGYHRRPDASDHHLDARDSDELFHDANEDFGELLIQCMQQQPNGSGGGGGGGGRSNGSSLRRSMKEDYSSKMMDPSITAATNAVGCVDGIMDDSSSQFKTAIMKRTRPMSDIKTMRRINMVTKDVNDIVKGIRYIQKINENKEHVNRIVSEWRAVGMVLDRLFFLIYLTTIILSSTLFFTDAKDDVIVGDISKIR